MYGCIKRYMYQSQPEVMLLNNDLYMFSQTKMCVFRVMDQKWVEIIGIVKQYVLAKKCMYLIRKFEMG